MPAPLVLTGGPRRWVVNGPDTQYIWFWKTTEIREAIVLKEGP
jgi:hypothetical protein